MTTNDSTIGKVYLVGAGPGDPGLITVRGRELLRRADVILYDALINAELLELAREGCEKVYVGKRAGSSSVTQRAINNEIIRHAKAGKRVVRLKGGDPYIYGRGGEEAMACKAAGVRVEVVPGVTSAIAVPAYAGIPVLQRNLAGSVLFLHGRFKARPEEPDLSAEATLLDLPAPAAAQVPADEPTGKIEVGQAEEAGERRGGVVIRRHRRPEKPAELKVRSQSVEVEQDQGDPSEDMGAMEVDWRAVARAADTLVVLMAMGSLETIRDGLISGGRPPEQPVAAIQWGTTPLQRTVISTVGKFPEEVREANLGSPAVLIIGEVVNLQGELDSYERRPLFGWRVAVLEPGDMGRDIADFVFEEGGRPVLFDCAKPPALAGSTEEFEALQEDFQNATHILFLSADVVPLFHQAAIGSNFDARTFLSTLRILAADEATLNALRDMGYPAMMVSGGPKDPAFQSVWESRIRDSNVIVIESEDEWSDLPDELEEAGAHVLTVPVSEYEANEHETRRLAAAMERREIQAIVFSTPWAARALVDQWGDNGRRYLDHAVVIAATEDIAGVLGNAAIDIRLVAGETDPRLLIEKIAGWRNENRSQEKPVGASS